jgi:hypothetical protein
MYYLMNDEEYENFVSLVKEYERAVREERNIMATDLNLKARVFLSYLRKARGCATYTSAISFAKYAASILGYAHCVLIEVPDYDGTRFRVLSATSLIWGMDGYECEKKEGLY